MFGNGTARVLQTNNTRCHMPDAIRIADLAALSQDERHARLAEFMAGRSAPLNGEVDALNRAIAEYEGRFRMSSDAMRDLLKSGRQHETADICAWMRLVDVRDRAIKSST